MKTEAFKAFVRANPSVFNAIRNKKMSWQEAYEAYDLYGSDYEGFKKLEEPIINTNNRTNQVDMNQILGFINSLDVERVNTFIESLNKGIDILKNVLPAKPSQLEKEKQIFERFND